MKVSPIGFQCLLLLLAHCPHAFSSLRLHKRMMAASKVTEVAEELKGATSTMPRIHSVTDMTHENGVHSVQDPILHPQQASLPDNAGNQFVASHPPHSTSASRGALDAKPPSVIDRTARYLDAILNRVGYFIERLRIKLFSSGAGTPRFFSHASKLEKTFAGLATHQGDLGAWVQSNVKIGKALKGKKATGEEREAANADIIQTVGKVQTFLRDLPARDEQFRKLHVKLEQNLESILLAQDKKQPIVRLGPALSSIQYDHFIAIQGAITKSSEPHISAAAQFHGLLGPNNIFSKQVEAILAEPKVKNLIPSDFDAKTFVDDVAALHDPFQKIVYYLDRLRSAEKQGMAKPRQDADLYLPLQKFHDKYAETLKPYEGLPGLLKQIKKSPNYDSLRREIMDPKDAAAAELALLEPFGIARDPGNILSKEFPSAKLGVTNEMRSKDVLKAQSADAEAIVKQRIEVNIQAKELTDSLLKHLDHTDLQLLGDSFKIFVKPKPASRM